MTWQIVALGVFIILVFLWLYLPWGAVIVDEDTEPQPLTPSQKEGPDYPEDHD